MDHLDLEGMLSAAASSSSSSSSSTTSWIMPPFDQQEANFLSTSRQMLEPIMEETSEDEENQNWSQFESVWSSESDTGSVIRIELHNDPDSVSERDFACPAKRPRRDDLLIVEEIPPLRKYQRNESLLLNVDMAQETFRKRFDEIYSDSDSLSFNSLSRSSSLIQFESLERQLQNDLSSAIGNSTPSLLIGFDTNDNKGSDSSLRRFESSDGRLHQTYFDLDKIDFNNTLNVFNEDQCSQVKSDSESSDTSILSHEERILKPKNICNNSNSNNINSDQRSCYKGKSSAENLSEDSGYCEHISALRIKSKSIPNFLKTNHKLSEEDEFENHKSLEMIFNTQNQDDHEIFGHSRKFENSVGCFGKENFPIRENQRDILKTKIDGKRCSSSSSLIVGEQIEQQRWYNCEYSDDGGGGKIYNSSVGHEENEVKNKMNSKQKKTLESSYVSSSLPDVRIQYDHVFDGNKINDYNNFSNERISDLYKYANKDQFSTVSSLPNNLNLIGDSSVNSNDSDYNQDDDDDDDNFAWNLRSSTSVRSENRLSASYSSGRNLVKPTQNFIAASYNNLTLLDYSGRSHRSSFTMSDYSGNSKRNSREFELGKGNFLLDEISSHFDRNLSILSDRDQESDLLTEFLDTERKSSNNQKDNVPPKVPARRSNSAKEHRVTAPVEKPPRKIYSTIKTFDLDPTNLQTSYAESLEKCNFDPKELSNTDLELLADYSIPVKRDFVVSTPNLNAFRRVRDDDDLCHVSSAHNSMNPIPGEKKLGILLPAGNSRNSLGKGVSFCPVVSEISWREQSSEECIDPDSLENLNNRSHDSNIGTTQTSIDSTDGIINNTEIQSIEITFEYAKPNTNEPKKIQPQQQHEEEVDEEEKHLEKQQNDQQQQLQHTEDYQQQELQQHEFKQHEEKQAELKQHEDKQHESNTAGNKRSCSNAIVSNVAIVEQSISSAASNEIPSTSTVNNCASSDHKNNKMDKDQVISDRDNKNVLKSNIANIKNNNININNNNNNNKISSASVKNTTTMPSSATANTGTDLLSSKFKPKPDEKHHKNSFLSRFTGGFRFSLRRKKKPSVVDDKNSNEGISKMKKSIADGAVKSSTSSTKNKTPDFIYIPLKGPLPEQTIQNNKTTLLSSCADKNIDNTRHLSSNGNGLNRNGSNGINHVLLGKPPLPKQPPRVVGVCEKIRACQRQQLPPSEIPLNPSNSGGNVRHAPVIRSSSQPREIDERFLDNERRFYYNDQLNGTMNGNGCNDDIIRGRPPTTNSSTTKYHNVKSNGNGGGIGTNGGSKIGLIETNLDTHETVISGKTRSLMELGPHSVRLTLNNQNTCNEHTDKTIIDGTSRRPHKSMEFLLDKENQKNVLPPENELQKSHDSTTALSEHQLRVQASLQRLNIPEWFRQYSSTPKTGGEPGGYKPGSFTRKRASDSGRWAGLNSKTTSLSSLGSQRSDRSPLMLSPSAHSHHGGQTGFSRWSTSHLNSTQTSPSVSTRGSFCRGGAVNSSFISGNSVSSAGNSSIRNSFRQPYLGWRSQEKLSQPRTPHERLASSLLTQQPQKSSEPAVTPEIQSSIKEVTSAIVHYVNDQTNRTSSRSRSASPNSRKCWLESSFVGIRQLDSPQTPNIENSFNPNSVTTTFTESGGQTSDIFRMNGVGESTII